MADPDIWKELEQQTAGLKRARLALEDQLEAGRHNSLPLSAFTVRDAWQRLLAEIEDDEHVAFGTSPPLRCSECAAIDDGRRGWTIRLDIDDEAHAFCPECDERRGFCG